MNAIIKHLPVDWQARLWWHIMRRRYGHTSHFKVEAYKALRASARLPLKDAKTLIDRVAGHSR